MFVTCVKYLQVTNMNGVNQKDLRRMLHIVVVRNNHLWFAYNCSLREAQGCFFADAEREHQILLSRRWWKAL